MNRGVKFIIAGLFVVMAAFVVINMLPDYGKTSSVGYELAQSLYSACNQKNMDHVNRVKAVLEKQKAEQGVGSNEYRWLQSIIRLAEKQRWKDATRESRKLLDAQVSQPTNQSARR